jgi:aminopeptidase-like protein
MSAPVEPDALSPTASPATLDLGAATAPPSPGTPDGESLARIRFPDLAEGLDFSAAGPAMHAWMSEVFPLCRSITGTGLRRTLDSLRGFLPLDIREVPTGTPVFDWRVPKEWEIRSAWIRDAQGRKVVDFGDNNLHVVGYSLPVHARMSLAELRPHLHSLPDRPDWIPFRTSFYEESWGFCLPDAQLRGLPEGEYEVHIDSSLRAGHLAYGEGFLPGRMREEILISAHACHPSLANDNLSGMAVAAFLAAHLKRLSDAGKPPRYSYRFLFAPTTIGSLTWLSRNADALPRIRHGLVLALLGESAPFTYKRSARGDAGVDLAAARALTEHGFAHTLADFSPFGYDERQFCSPGFDLPMGCLMRTPNGRFPEYHTSADNLAFVKPEALAESLRACVAILDVLESDGVFRNLSPFGEPQLGKRGLYKAVGNRPDPGREAMALLWVLNLAGGKRSLMDMAARSRLEFAAVKRAAATLLAHGLLEEMPAGQEVRP